MNFGDMSFQDYFLSGTSNNNLAEIEIKCNLKNVLTGSIILRKIHLTSLINFRRLHGFVKYKLITLLCLLFVDLLCFR